ncbi:MAG: methylmalonyl Co-A mutase-associated GTPase MeaB, partial [Veillonella sp.]|nr:methylmalonyl Co-A mutase-associated GTPase MeaB [Veillonella sp.]
FFMLIVLTGAGDELQGIKKGVMELADAIVVNKADGDNLKRALIARSDYDRMLHYIRPATEKWKTQAYTCSAVTKDGLDELWDVIQEFTEQGKENGVFFIQGRMGEVEAAVLDGEMSESQAVEELIGVFDKSLQ